MIPETDLVLRAFARRPPEDLAKDLWGPKDAAPSATPELIAFILERYHETHRREFPEAIRLARKVEATHAQDPDCPVGLADHLAMIADDLEGHQRKEETVLFPMMLQGGGQMVRFPIARMMSEHVDVDEQLDHLEAMTDMFTAPIGACAAWRDLYRICGKIDRDLREHMRLENEVLFARFL
ncbi:MAG TPA: hemerythrin domain-containing protein [Phenylobacterium sp.]|nr:hemerythrin domain-containing protein [Phenylobacterium sp.]